MLKAFENCPFKGYRMYIAKDLPRTKATEAMTWGQDVHKALDARISKDTPLPATMIQFEPMAAAIKSFPSAMPVEVPPHVYTEEKLGVNKSGQGVGFFDDDVFGRGVIDVLMVRAPIAVIVDWKTGKRREDPAELEIFAMLLQATRPHIATILGTYEWLQEGEVGKMYDLSDTGTTWKAVNKQMQEITKMQKTLDFPKTPNPLCGWCPVLDCVHNKSKPS